MNTLNPTAGPHAHGGIKLSEMWSAVRRRLRPMTYTFAGVLLAFAAAAVLWPPTYRSTGTILIEQQEVPKEFVRSAVTSYADQRIQVISQRVMTSANLLGIVEKYKLYPDKRDSDTRERLIDRMRKDIQLNMISAEVMDPAQGRATRATIAFSVSYDSRLPTLAARVANELTTLYLSENIETRKQLAADTAGFLLDETARLGQECRRARIEDGDVQGGKRRAISRVQHVQPAARRPIPAGAARRRHARTFARSAGRVPRCAARSTRSFGHGLHGRRGTRAVLPRPAQGSQIAARLSASNL